MGCTEIEKITPQQLLDEVVRGKKNALVQISEMWNGSSQMVCHLLQSLIVEHSDKLNFFLWIMNLLRN